MSLSDWCIERILTHGKVKNVTKVKENLLEIATIEGRIFWVFIKSDEQLTLSSLDDSVDFSTIDFFLNIKVNAYTNTDLFSYSLEYGFPIGALKDLYRALNLDNIKTYIDPTASFILNGLKQHHKVTDVVRLDSHRFLISRSQNLPPVTILAINDYDFTAESIRSRLHYIQDFNAILTSNPNCRRSSNCQIVADSVGKKIYSWAELLSALNKK